MAAPAIVERSRSGNGAHVWFFFSAPVAASTARKMGCHLITETVALPRGCRPELEELLRVHGVSLNVEDQRAGGMTLDLRFQGTLTPVQEQATRALMAHDIGVFVAPAGVGKTVIGTYLVATRACSQVKISSVRI